MKDIKKVHDLVKDILESNIDARNSDSVLYVLVVMRSNEIAATMPFEYVMRNLKTLGIPKFESVSRVRRKLQNDYPELKPSESVIDQKYENWKVVKEYAVI